MVLLLLQINKDYYIYNLNMNSKIKIIIKIHRNPLIINCSVPPDALLLLTQLNFIKITLEISY